MWLSPEILSWNAYIDDRLYKEDAEGERAYQIWAHAEEILKQHIDAFHLVDVVTTLKRAMSHRLQFLKDSYKFEAIPVKKNPQRIIEQLAFWGIIRPTMLTKLIDIRNALEHEDATPPTHERCIELLDFVWYFLRSTDSLAVGPPIAFVLYIESGDTYDLALKTGPKNKWRIDFGGWINASLLSDSKKEEWFEIQISRQETRDEVRRYNELASKAHEKKKEDDLLVEGTITGPENKMQQIYERYFKLALLNH
jgi:hypothetical protein